MNPLKKYSTSGPQPEIGLPFFTDPQGRAYRILWYDEDWEAYLLHRGRRVGHITLDWDLPRVKLADIRVEPTYRRRGLGTAALRVVIDLAQHKGATEITAFIVWRDAARMPDLPAWYARRGFRVTPGQSSLIAYDLSLALT
jgi:GNAT superfamily N-acetyltransferase